MARKPYTIQFLLEAQSKQGFTTVFSKAQAELQGLQQEITALNRLQGDISAYQKQQASVDATRQKLEILQKQYDNLQQEMKETGSDSAELKNKLLAKQLQIDRAASSLDKQTKKLEDMGQALRDAGVDTEKLEDESRRLSGELGDLKDKQTQVAESAGRMGDTAAEAFEAAGDALIAAGLVSGLRQIYDAYEKCVQVAGGFETAMSNVEALSGATREELAALSAQAKELGATTKYTAAESAEAMGYMAMAGWSAEQMLSGMPGVIALAAASGEDLATVSDIVTDSMTAFGLDASQTARYADVLAATATSANTSVGIMGETFKYAAPVAGALGYSIEDVSVAVGLMANAGVKASNAGTALRNVFNGLLGGVTLTAEAFGEAEFSAIKADGSMESLGESVERLRGYFEQMTAAERVQNAQNIAGMRGYAGLLAILNATEEDYSSLTRSINDCAGAAQRMADIKLDNMEGQLTLAQSALEAVETTIGETFTPMLAELYGAGAQELSQINEFLQQNPALIKAVTVFAAGAGSVVTAVTGINAAMKVFQALNVASLFAGPAATVMGLGTAAAAVTAAFIALKAVEEEREEESFRLTAASRQEYEALQALRLEYEAAAEAYGENSDEALVLAWRVQSLERDFETNKQTVSDYVEELSALRDSLDEELFTLDGSYEEIDREERSTLALIGRLRELTAETEHSTSSQEEMKAIIAELNRRVPELALSYEAVTAGVTDWGEAAEETVRALAATQRYETAQKTATEAYEKKVEAQEALLRLEKEHSAAQERFTKASAAYWAEADSLGPDDAVSWAVTNELQEATEEFAALDGAYQDLQATLQTAEAAYGTSIAVMTEYTEATREAAQAEKDAQDESDRLAEALGSAQTRAEELTEAYNAALETALSSIRGQYALWDEAAEVAETKTEDINKALESQQKYWTEYNDNLTALQERTGEIEGLSDVLASFADGSKGSVSAVAGMAKASDEDLRKMVESWQALQKTQQETSDRLAKMRTQYTEEMEALTEDISRELREMDLSEEGSVSGKTAIDGFVEAAGKALPRVQNAYAALGQAAAEALHWEEPEPTRHYINGPTYLPAYASGTQSAAPGLALVGEEGPELVYLKGGETVLPAQETARLFTEGCTEYVISFAPVYHITGGVEQDGLEATLRAHDGALRDEMERLLRELGEDRRRRAYL